MLSARKAASQEPVAAVPDSVTAERLDRLSVQAERKAIAVPLSAPEERRETVVAPMVREPAVVLLERLALEAAAPPLVAQVVLPLRARLVASAVARKSVLHSWLQEAQVERQARVGLPERVEESASLIAEVRTVTEARARSVSSLEHLQKMVAPNQDVRRAILVDQVEPGYRVHPTEVRLDWVFARAVLQPVVD